MSSPPKSFARAFAVPSVLAALTAIGLLTALLGFGEWTSWIALTVPIGLTGYCIARGRLA
ncbi:hypothetical protein LZC95_46410 [Pendulispora brunnea]|uniref:Uncharacterized protein n=1 Tax=Pendulispora brunnea TaxID=2905690 RepID=A0ABZ2KBV8_9BACT